MMGIEGVGVVGKEGNKRKRKEEGKGKVIDRIG